MVETEELWWESGWLLGFDENLATGERKQALFQSSQDRSLWLMKFNHLEVQPKFWTSKRHRCQDALAKWKLCRKKLTAGLRLLSLERPACRHWPLVGIWKPEFKTGSQHSLTDRSVCTNMIVYAKHLLSSRESGILVHAKQKVPTWSIAWEGYPYRSRETPKDKIIISCYLYLAWVEIASLIYLSKVRH